MSSSRPAQAVLRLRDLSAGKDIAVERLCRKLFARAEIAGDHRGVDADDASRSKVGGANFAMGMCDGICRESNSASSSLP
jgi:hypothetical protein